MNSDSMHKGDQVMLTFISCSVDPVINLKVPCYAIAQFLDSVAKASLLCVVSHCLLDEA